MHSVHLLENASSIYRVLKLFNNFSMINFMQIFLDEVNTSSCPGLFKEIIIDKTLDGKVSSYSA